ncbi:MAG: hypothetical protein JNN15_10290 [Blastocatellia bacterium]|nr:hypothetical protein [Blastocatellia bacterium]
MTYRISQFEDSGRLTLKIEGSLNSDSGKVLEQICEEFYKKYKQIEIDLMCVTFLAPETSAVLCRLKRELGVVFNGCHLFNKKMIDQLENQ